MIRKPYSFLNATPRERRRPLFPVPEDIFASEDQVAERHKQEIRSPAIDQAINDWNAAKEQSDDDGLRAAAKALVDVTSAAFKLQGVPVYAHPVLPPQFVTAEAADIARLPKEQQQAMVARLLDRFEPSVKTAGTQQFVESLRMGQPDTSLVSDPQSPPKQVAQARPQQPTPPPSPSYPPLGYPSAQGQQAQQPPATRQRNPEWWQQKPLLPTEDGGEAALDPKPRRHGPFAPPPPLEQPGPDHEYGAWSRNPNARTDTGSLLVSPDRLSQRQQENLMRRSWIHPTGKLTGAGRLEQGWGYFGAPRKGANAPYHGGFDAPYRYPTDPDYDENGRPIAYDRTVRLPTRAICKGFTANSQGGASINRLSFDLGDGITLELLHIQVSPALDAKLKAAQRAGKPLELDAGEVLGDIDAGHDHTHVQMIVAGPNGERWVVDPTYFMEERARTFWREPQNDLVDSVIDLGRGAVDWTRRQFE